MNSTVWVLISFNYIAYVRLCGKLKIFRVQIAEMVDLHEVSSNQPQTLTNISARTLKIISKPVCVKNVTLNGRLPIALVDSYPFRTHNSAHR